MCGNFGTTRVSKDQPVMSPRSPPRPVHRSADFCESDHKARVLCFSGTMLFHLHSRQRNPGSNRIREACWPAPLKRSLGCHLIGISCALKSSPGNGEWLATQGLPLPRILVTKKSGGLCRPPSAESAVGAIRSQRISILAVTSSLKSRRWGVCEYRGGMKANRSGR